MNRSFVVTYAASAAALAAAFGGITSQQWLASSRYGMEALILQSLLRAIAPMASGSALLLALVLWVNREPASRLRAELRPSLRRAFFVVLPVHALASLLTLVVCFGMAAAMRSLSLAEFWGWLTWLRPQDFAVSFSAALLDSLLILVLAFRFAARLQTLGSLPAKLVVVLTVTVPLRASLALILSSILSA